MKSARLAAFVLTAGYGSRLRPLTLFLPKALLPVCGEVVAGHSLKQLARVGCEYAVLNLHYLGDLIAAHFGSSYCGLPIDYSYEDEILGTLGALYPRKDQLQNADLLLLVNGDSLCWWPWKAMIRQHLRLGSDVTLLLHHRPPSEVLGGPVGVDKRGAVVKLRDAQITDEIAHRHVFAGAHVISTTLLDRVKEGSGDIISDLYIPLLKEGAKIHSLVTRRRWHDLGTPDRYLASCLDWARYRKRIKDLRLRSVVSPSTSIDESAVIRRSVIESGVRLDAETRVEGSLILNQATVTGDSLVKDSIVGPGVALPEGCNIERRMVTRFQTGYQPKANESLMADLLYTPLQES